MTAATSPSPPTHSGGPPASWPHSQLYKDVKEALYGLPSLFKTSLRIAGISATDLFSLNSALGAAIEASVVENLNSLRRVWDPTGKYDTYSFVRQAQVFPDVLLQTTNPAATEKILLGLELKGWFVLAKEGEPSFRYRASANACAPQDLLVVFPWGLDEVVSGTPRLYRPFVEEARYAAERRNYYWEYEKGAPGPNTKVTISTTAVPYPAKSAKFNDEPVNDSGNNFGRVARSRIMDKFIDELLAEPISGVPGKYWYEFLKIFSEGASTAKIDAKLNSIKSEVLAAAGSGVSIEALDRIKVELLALISKS